MRKNKIVAVMLLVFVLALSFVLTACVTDEHQCTSKCPECGKCLNKECTQEACKEKCPGHEEKPEHVCGHKCPTCGKCTDTTCTDPVCADKCPGHEPTPPAHECTSKCPVCGKCTNKDCTEEVCKDKCQGHHPDTCPEKCPVCDGCTDDECTNPACEIKCDCVVNDKRALANALTFVKTQYQDVITTTKDYTLPAVQPINGYEADRVTTKKYDVAITWTLTKISGLDVVTLTLDETKNLYNVTVTYGPETNAQETTYKISATFTIGTETATWSMERTVPAFVFTTYAEYLTGCEKQSDTVMNIKAYVIGAIQDGKSIGSLYVQDAQGNGYYVYKPDFDGKKEAGTLDRDKVNQFFPVGTEVIVTGVGKVYGGQYEFTSNDNSKTWPTVTKTGRTAEEVGVTLGYKDGTADWSAAANSEDSKLVKYQNSLVELKLVTMKNVDDKYYYFTIGDKKVEYNLYSNVYFITDAENKTLFDKFVPGNTATVKGIVSVFSKKYQIYPVSVEAISNVQEPDRTDAEKITFEHDLLNVDKTVSIDGYQMKLTTVGTKYNTVKIAWTSDSENCVVKDGVATFTVPDTGSVKVTLTAVFTCGEATQTFTYEITVEPMAATSVADLIAAKVDANKVYKIVGWIVASGGDKDKAGSFVVSDGTGAIFSYNKQKVEVGNKVIVYGTRSDSNGVAQLGTTKLVVVTPEEGETFTEGEATEWAAADIDLSKFSKDNIAEYTGKYYKITGSTYALDGSYTITQYNGKQLLSLYMNSGLTKSCKAYIGKEVIVYGWVRGCYTGKYLTIQVTKVEKVAEPEKTDADKVAAEKAALEKLALTIKETGTHDIYTATEEGVTITWALKEGSAATVENNKLVVATLPDADATVKLTATIICGESTETVDVTVTVKKVFVAPTTPEEIVNAAWALPKDTTLEGGTYTLTGKVTIINEAYSSQHKNVTLTIVVGDLTDKPILCFHMGGTKAAVVAVNDTITVKGTLKNYGGTIEFDGGCEVTEYIEGTSTITVKASNATVTITDNQTSGVNGSKFTFKVEIEEGYELVSVKVNGTAVEAVEGTYTGTISGDTIVEVATKKSGVEQKTETISILAYATANSWANGTKYTSWTSGDVTVSVAKGGDNSGKYYTTGNEWRLYGSESASVKIEIASGYKIVSVKLTYNVKSNGVALVGETSYASGTTIDVNDSSLTFSVKTGQVKVTAIEVVYEAI